MTSEDVRRLVMNEIDGDWGRTNAHGCDLRRCLVEPREETFEGLHNPEPIDLWLVLEEVPDTRDGYKVVYHEEAGRFGLAIPSSRGRAVFIGLYGGFLDAYDAM